MKEIGLYLHFPFCVRKCAYCDFLSFPADEELKRIYAIAMIREIRGYAKAASSYRVGSIYLGGGTPSLMPARMMKEIMNTVRDHFEVDPDAEISMEVNPGTVNPSNLGFIAEAVNRVSLGVQSANDEELKTLGRIHTFRDAERSAGLIRQAGIANLNLDLMLGIPGQTCASFRDSLEAVLALRPEHISAYSLIVEEGTEFRRLQKEGKLMLPDEDSEREMYAAAGDILGRAGFNRYEFSNYARTGYRCRHNVRYWKRGYYLGFGIGAASFFEGSRWKNTGNIDHYIEDSADPGRIISEMEQLDVKSGIEEFMFLGLRMTEGVTEQDFTAAFSLSLRDVYGEILDRHVNEGLLATDGRGRYFLTDRGAEVSNVVLADYLL